MEKWTLPYKIHKVGCCDLIGLWVRASPLKCQHNMYRLSNDIKLCHQTLQTKGLREGGREGLTDFGQQVFA